MIRIDRGDEPEDLIQAREMRLARAHLDGPPSASSEFVDYDPDVVRDRLTEKQHYKCAYCEFPVQREAYPIEHFRPKLDAENPDWGAVASDEPPAELADITWSQDRGLYWWLAWTWENLFYSCPTCNSPKFKGNRFPLQRGAEPPLAMSLPQPSQSTLIIDPSNIDPLDHLQFVPDTDLDHWKPVGITMQGKWTIRIFGLDKRTSLRDAHSLHVKNRIRQNHYFIAVKQALDAGEVAELQASCTNVLDALLSEEQPYLALTYCLLDQEVRVPAHERLNLELPLPRPGKIATYTPKPLISARPDISDLDPALQWRIRALGRRAESYAHLRNLIVDIVRARNGCTAIELSTLLDRNIVTLRCEYLDPLCQEAPSVFIFDAITQRYCPS